MAFRAQRTSSPRKHANTKVFKSGQLRPERLGILYSLSIDGRLAR